MRTPPTTRSLLLAAALLAGPAPAAAEPGTEAIALIELRDHVVELRLGQSEHLYSIRSTRGVLLVEDATLDEITALLPAVGAALRSAVAGPHEGFLWAGN